MIRSLIMFLLIIINFVISTTLLKDLSISNVSANILLIMTVSFGLIRGKKEGAIIGVAIGLLHDIFFGNNIGFYALLYMYTGFFAGNFNRTFYRDSIMIPLGIIVVADFIFNFVIYILSYLLRGRVNFEHYFFNVILPEMLLTALFFLVLYRFYLYINTKLETKEQRKENTIR